MDWIIALVALTCMEIILGIDNVVFIAILCGRLPESQRKKARLIGLGLALVLRILLLFSIKWVMGLTDPLFSLGFLTTWGLPEAYLTNEVLEISWRDLILLGGGLFLIANSVKELHHKMEDNSDENVEPEVASLGSVLVQIALLDLIFSLDSVITAVGMAEDIWVMVVAVVIAIIVMMVFSGAISRFIDKHATLKVLALSFLILIGVMLLAEGLGTHINKGYIYFAMAFSLIIEMVNLRVRSVAKRLGISKSELKKQKPPVA
ncbi:Integral membrane protein TerC family protein [Polystyrenella longa]|uniref:Integral membrane protein TerC family protein n=1 Tax=Polystyrenella longa TaxID=2528007 RepID=A0A518CGH9_9PLAN|nr:TerC family protein [Polystyrenella longa]QDU78333.1 Integral membrane protein TerC family protein [Polystyrenella longa]